MKIEVLGCSGGIGGARRTSSFLIDESMLIDAGSGVADLELGRMAKIDHVFLTHAHLDHIMMLPLLADAVWFMRQRAIHVYALAPTCEALAKHLFNGVLWPDYTRSPSEENPYLELHAIENMQTLNVNGIAIMPVTARHSIPATGYCVAGEQGAIAFSGDTTLCAEFFVEINRMEKLQHLIIESTFLSAHASAAEKSGHMTPKLLGEALQFLQPGVQVWINHMESGREEETMKELEQFAGRFAVKILQRGDTLNI